MAGWLAITPEAALDPVNATINLGNIMMHNKTDFTPSNAQKLATFLNSELKMPPERVNKALDILREAIPQVMWDIPEEQ